jgi:hypothetical protein
VLHHFEKIVSKSFGAAGKIASFAPQLKNK